MNAASIIEEIKRLPDDEREVVIQFTQGLRSKRKLSGAELAEMAGKMVEASDPAEADQIQETILEGFYGAKNSSWECSSSGLRTPYATNAWKGYSSDPLAYLADWLDKEPEVPEGEWFTRFPGMIVCGEGE